MVVEPLDDAVEHIAGLIEPTGMKQRLPQPQGRRRGLIRMFGERERLAQVSSRLRPLRLILGCAQGQQLPPLLHCGRLTKRALQIRDSACRRPTADCLCGRPLEHRHDPGLTRGRRLQQMSGDGIERHPRPRKPADGLEVHAAAPRRRDPALNRRAQDRMLDVARADGSQDADLQQRVRGARHLIDWKVGQVGAPMQFGAGLEQGNVSATLRAWVGIR
jgi:hypothetical protein